VTITPETLEEIYSLAYDVADRANKSADDPDGIARRAGLVAVAEAVLQATAEDEQPIYLSPKELAKLQHEMNRRMSVILHALKAPR
jgi:hypothetical protein